MVPVGGKSNLIRPCAIALDLGICGFVVFDADGHEMREDRREQHSKDNLVLLNLLGAENPEAFPSSTLWGHNYAMWPEDIRKVIETDCGELWQECQALVSCEYEHAANMQKNELYIASVMHQAWEKGERFPSLDKLTTQIETYCGLRG